MITLDGLELPSGLYWENELTWNDITQNISYSITGAVIIQESTLIAGRKIILKGGKEITPITRENLLILKNKLTSYDENGYTLILNDNQTFTVIPVPELKASCWTGVMEYPTSYPLNSDIYILEEITFYTI